MADSPYNISFVLTREEVFRRGALHPFSWLYTASQVEGPLWSATKKEWYSTGTKSGVLKAAKVRADELGVRFVLIDRTKSEVA